MHTFTLIMLLRFYFEGDGRLNIIYTTTSTTCKASSKKADNKQTENRTSGSRVNCFIEYLHVGVTTNEYRAEGPTKHLRRGNRNVWTDLRAG